MKIIFLNFILKRFERLNEALTKAKSQIKLPLDIAIKWVCYGLLFILSLIDNLILRLMF